MKAKLMIKKAVQILLLAFVAVSVLVLLNNELLTPVDSEVETSNEENLAEAETETHNDSDGASSEVPTVENDDGEQVVVYYFHGNMRCVSCRTMEAYVRESLENNFADELAEELLVFREVNVDAPENRHYIQDFQLVNRSVVVATYVEDEAKSYKNLEELWQLLKDKEAFQTLFYEETKEQLAGVDA